LTQTTQHHSYFENAFDGKFDGIFPYLDKIEDRLSMTGVAHNCKITIEEEDDYEYLNLFKNFGTLKLLQAIMERDNL